MSKPRQSNNNVPLSTKPAMSESLRNRIAELTNQPKARIRRGPQALPDQSVGRHIQVPPRRDGPATEKFNFKKPSSPITPVTPSRLLPERPSRNAPTPRNFDNDKLVAKAILNRSRRNSPVNLNGNGSNSTSPVQSMLETKRSPRPSVLVRNNHSNADDETLHADELAEQRERLKIIEQTRARLIGLRLNHGQSTSSPQTPPENSGDHGPSHTPKSYNKPIVVNQKSSDTKPPLRTFFSQSEVSNDLPSTRHRIAEEDVKKTQLANIDEQQESDYIIMLKEKNRDEIQSLRQQLKQSELRAANLEDSLSKLDDQLQSKHRQLQEQENQKRQDLGRLRNLQAKNAELEQDLQQSGQSMANMVGKQEHFELQRQFDKAQEQLLTSISLNELQEIRVAYERDIDDLKQQNQDQTDELEQCKANLQSAQDQSRSLRIDLADQERTTKSLENELEIIKNEYDLLANQITTEKRTGLVNNTRLMELEDQLHKNEDERLRLQTELDNANSLLSELKDTKLRLEKSQNLVSMLEQDLQKTRNQLTKQDEQRQNLSAALEQEKINVADLEHQLNDAEQRVVNVEDETQRNLTELLNIYEQVQSENEQLHQKLSAATRKSSDSDIVKQMKSENSSLRSKVQEMENAMRHQSNSLKQSINRVSKQYISNDEELLVFIENMTAKVDNYRSELDQLRVENKALKNNLHGGGSNNKAHNIAATDSAYASSQTHSPTDNRLLPNY